MISLQNICIKADFYDIQTHSITHPQSFVEAKIGCLDIQSEGSWGTTISEWVGESPAQPESEALTLSYRFWDCIFTNITEMTRGGWDGFPVTEWVRVSHKNVNEYGTDKFQEQ